MQAIALPRLWAARNAQFAAFQISRAADPVRGTSASRRGSGRRPGARGAARPVTPWRLQRGEVAAQRRHRERTGAGLSVGEALQGGAPWRGPGRQAPSGTVWKNAKSMLRPSPRDKCVGIGPAGHGNVPERGAEECPSHPQRSGHCQRKWIPVSRREMRHDKPLQGFGDSKKGRNAAAPAGQGHPPDGGRQPPCRKPQAPSGRQSGRTEPQPPPEGERGDPGRPPTSAAASGPHRCRKGKAPHAPPPQTAHPSRRLVAIPRVSP